MENNSKLLIYKGIIQYLLDETGYTLKHIADLSSSHINNLRSIYCEGKLLTQSPWVRLIMLTISPLLSVRVCLGMYWLKQQQGSCSRII